MHLNDRDEFDEDDEETEDSDDENRMGESTSSSNDDDEDGEEGDGAGAGASTRRSSRQKKSSSTSRSRRGGASTRSSRVIDDDEDDELELDETEDQPRSRGSSSNANSSSKQKKAKRDGAVHHRGPSKRAVHPDLDGLSFERRWLQTDAPTPQYSPQMGDKVMYLPQGHIVCLQEHQEGTSPPWLAFPQKWPIVECEVRDIQYKFPDASEGHKGYRAIKAIVQLAVVRVPSRNTITAGHVYQLDLVIPRATRNSASKEITFEVTLRDWDLPEFLVPSDVFLRSVRLAWHRGIRLSAQFKNFSVEEQKYVFVEYAGQVEGLSNATPEWPNSPWEALQIRWDESVDGEELSRMGPWEVLPQFDPNSEFSRILSHFPMAVLDSNEAQRIAREIDVLMDKHKTYFEPFQYEVDSTEYPTYYSHIALPMYVDLIRRRLDNHFYRQVRILLL